MKLDCSVNGADISADVSPRLLLSDFLRHDLRLTGTHVGCEMGACGACTVQLDGEAIRSCLIFAVQADGCAVSTVEGLAVDGQLNEIQQAFHEHHALQCGYCTAGFLMTIDGAMKNGLLPENEEDIRILLSGNLCRCTGYQNIVNAVMSLREKQLARLHAPAPQT